jgi:hypothetical protein
MQLYGHSWFKRVILEQLELLEQLEQLELKEQLVQLDQEEKRVIQELLVYKVQLVLKARKEMLEQPLQ